MTRRGFWLSGLQDDWKIIYHNVTIRVLHSFRCRNSGPDQYIRSRYQDLTLLLVYLKKSHCQRTKNCWYFWSSSLFSRILEKNKCFYKPVSSMKPNTETGFPHKHRVMSHECNNSRWGYFTPINSITFSVLIQKLWCVHFYWFPIVETTTERIPRVFMWYQ